MPTIVEPHRQTRGTITRPTPWGDIPPTRWSRHYRQGPRPGPWADGGVEMESAPGSSGAPAAPSGPVKTALVTGASSGIGYELAKLFLDDGYRLVMVAQDAARLTAIAQDLAKRRAISVKVIAKDLALPSAPVDIVAELDRERIVVDVLVNNAGFGTYGPFADSDPDGQWRMMQVNMVALTSLTRLLLPGMLTRRAGRILNVASTAAFQPGPLMAVYYASKAYVLSFSEALANELRGSGVSVTVLCPGPTRTEFQRRAGVAHATFMRGRIMDARSVALSGYRGLMAGKTLVIPGVRNRLLTSAVRCVPRAWATRIVRSIQESRR